MGSNAGKGYNSQPTDAEVEEFRRYCEEMVQQTPRPVPMLEAEFRELPRISEHYACSLTEILVPKSINLASCPVCGSASLGGPCTTCLCYLVALALPDSVAADGRTPYRVFRELHSHLRSVRRKNRSQHDYWVKSAHNPKEALRAGRIQCGIINGLLTRDVQ